MLPLKDHFNFSVFNDTLIKDCCALEKNPQIRIQQYQKDFSGFGEIIECLTSDFIGQNLKRQHLKIN